MIEVLINYIPDKKCFGVYEQSTDTLLYAESLSEALVLLSAFLRDSGLITEDILSCNNISYHMDSYTVKAMVESNVNLMKRLSNAPSGFMISSQRFGSSMTQNNKKDNSGGDFKTQSKFGRSSLGGKKGKNFSNSSFSGNSNFKTSFKKFGGYGD